MRVPGKCVGQAAAVNLAGPGALQDVNNEYFDGAKLQLVATVVKVYGAQMTAGCWGLVPFRCPGLLEALPHVNSGAGGVRELVKRLSPDDRHLLTTAIAATQTRFNLPTELVQKIVCMAF